MAGIEILNNFVKKTLKQVVDKKLLGNQTIDFVEKISTGGYEPMVGAYEEFASVVPISSARFSDNAFVQTDANFSSTGTGLLANNLNNVDNQWINKYRFVMINPDAPSNINFVISNYRSSKYKDILLTEEFPQMVLGLVQHSIELQRANDLIFGRDFIEGVSGTTKHYNGLKDLIDAAKEDTAVSDITNLDITGYSTKYIDLSSDVTDLESMSNLNTIFEYANSNSSTAFCFGTTSAGSANPVKYITESLGDVVMVVQPSFLEAVKVKNLQFYKILTDEYINKGKMVVLPKSTFNVSYEDGVLTSRLVPIQNATASGYGYINLGNDEILMIDKSSWIKRTYDGIQINDSEFTANNITTSNKATEIHAFDYLPTGVCLVVKAPKLIDLTENSQTP